MDGTLYVSMGALNSLLSVDEEGGADFVPGVASVVSGHGHPVVAQHEKHAVRWHCNGNVPYHLVHLPVLTNGQLNHCASKGAILK